MAEPTIVPPVPTVRQGDRIGDADAAVSIQKAFDKALPAIKTQPTPTTQQTPPTPTPPEPTPQKTPPPISPEAPASTPSPPEAQPPVKPEEVDVPSFLEEALRGGGPAATPTPPAADEWPEELPNFKNSDEAKARYKSWREAHKTMKSELETLRSKPPAGDPQQQEKINFLTSQNQQMAEMLNRYGVEHSAEFQQNVMRPLQASWYEAARIVKEGGGDPNALAKAMTLQGKSQFEALDEIFQDLPESAKAEAHDALRQYRRYDQERRAYLANAPAAMEGIRKRELERQLQENGRQRNEMKGIFESAIKHLTDQKLEVLLKTDQPEGEWWNKQSDQIVETARNLYLENTDMSKIAIACALAPAAEAYRKLWLNSQKKIGQLQRVIKERIGNEPDLSEHGGPGNITPSDQQFQADLKQPFDKVFLRTFHELQGQGK